LGAIKDVSHLVRVRGSANLCLLGKNVAQTGPEDAQRAKQNQPKPRAMLCANTMTQVCTEIPQNARLNPKTGTETPNTTSDSADLGAAREPGVNPAQWMTMVKKVVVVAVAGEDEVVA
jgi:hypothetical protein